MNVVAITNDLMDRSKITAAFGDAVRVVRDASDLGTPDVVLVDLDYAARVGGGVVGAAVDTGSIVIGFGSHVDEAALADACTLGAKAMARSVFFRRLREGTLLG